MAAIAPSIQTGRKTLGWPRWVASLAGSAVEVPRHRRIALGRSDSERRLNLFCESGGLEPQVAASANSAVVFEGILYNGEALAKELGTERPPSDDASILLEAYHRWGEGFLQRIRGLFALLIWDRNRDTLLCARDALGNHPLFFGRGNGEVVLSTALDSIAHHPAISAKLNRPAIANYFLDFYPKLTETFYTDIQRVPPGHLLKVHGREHRVYRYWEPQPPAISYGWKSEDNADDAVAEFDGLFSQAIERCFDFGPLGIYLSGGLDSVSIAAVAADLSARRGVPPPYALSLIFPTDEANEEPVQKAVGARLGLAQELVPFEAARGSEGLLASALRMSTETSQPLQNYFLGAYNSLAKLAKHHGYRAILTGTGGDEWLGVSPLVAADLIRAFDFGGLYRFWNQTQRSFRTGPFRYIAPRVIWSFGLRALLRDGTVRMLRRLSPSTLNRIRQRHLCGLVQPWQRIDPELWRELRWRAETVETDRTREPAECGAYIAESRCGLDHPLVSWDEEEVFENGKNIGIRFLHPYIDAELVEMLYRTPPAVLNRGGMTKGLVRETVAKRFPGLGFDRQKKIQLTKFFPLIMRSEGPQAWRSLGGAKALASLGLADVERADSSVKTALNSDDHPAAFRAWLLMTMEAWLRPRI